MMAPASSSNFLDAVMRVESVYPSAQAFIRAYELLKNPNVNVSDLVGAIKTDSSLTTDIIRISNSAIYGSSMRVSNLQAAILKVGFGEVIRLVGLSLARNFYMGDLYHYGLPSRDSWRLSIASALLVETFAMQIGVYADDGYTLGLLHSIGKVFINQAMDELKVEAVYDGSEPVQAWERRIAGFDFAFAGSAVMRKWSFPPGLCDAILYQLEPVVASDASPLLSALTFSLQFFHQIDVPMDKEIEPIVDATGFLAHHRMHEEIARELVYRVRGTFQKLVRAYDADDVE